MSPLTTEQIRSFLTSHGCPVSDTVSPTGEELSNFRYFLHAKLGVTEPRLSEAWAHPDSCIPADVLATLRKEPAAEAATVVAVETDEDESDDTPPFTPPVQEPEQEAPEQEAAPAEPVVEAEPEVSEPDPAPVVDEVVEEKSIAEDSDEVADDDAPDVEGGGE